MTDKNKTIFNFLAILGFLIGLTTFAQAQATRTWVSGVGDDANPCSRTAPCKTFAGTISKTAANGEISVLDPGGFGAVTITKSITIDGSPFTAGVLVSGTNGIIINDGGANNITVTLRGLDIDGLGTGLSGVKILSAKSVNIENSTIYGFSNYGISDERTGGGSLFVTNTFIKNTTLSSIAVIGNSNPAINAMIDNVKLFSSTNDNGLLVMGGNKAVISNSTISGNAAGAGVFAGDPNTEISVEKCVITNNAYGIRAGVGAPVIRISNNTVTKNVMGLVPGKSNGQIISYGNNNISGNDVESSPSSTMILQ